ncbi:IscS subfamily cysteine desulfurase [Legionella pneumophila]|uniref:IscS subfamily cysteine desulfurase n=1 Tax=Legionella pneumophila TaxID=446 RepID=UPI00077710FE|nr:IscS subfamily cysteine desulfurase [Legionella pneumophila]AUB71830.1 IscS subfamily cysteine desulfurase [Legionella pneumophila]
MGAIKLAIKPIYFDYMATTPVDPRVVEQMIKYLGPEGDFGNPASVTHEYGRIASMAVEQARSQIAETINASPQEIVFTSGATEADNLAILGAARFYKNKGMHLVTMSTEHKAVLDSFHQLEKEGFQVTYLNPESDGLLSLEKLELALRSDTILVSVMHVNNEIGVIQDIASIGELLRNKGIIFHVDAAQSAGKLPIDLSQLSVDLMSFSAHKNYGPKGVGALYVRHKPRIRLQALSYGGGHEGGLRSGTLPTHQIVGMGEAFVIAEAERSTEQTRILSFRKQLWEGIQHLPAVRLNGHADRRIAGNLNVSFVGLNGDSLLFALNELAVSTTSACSSASIQPSYVLRAIGLTDTEAQSAIRLSIGRFTSAEQIKKAIDIICTQVSRLHELSPL